MLSCASLRWVLGFGVFLSCPVCVCRFYGLGLQGLGLHHFRDSGRLGFRVGFRASSGLVW